MRARVVLCVAAIGVPAAIIVGTVTGWGHRAIGLPTWASWAVAVPVTAVGLLIAWGCTSFSRDGATRMLLKAYRRDGIEAAERQHLLLASPVRAGLQWFNVVLALQREGDEEAAVVVCRHASECGFPPAMAKLAYFLDQRGETAEAQELYRRALEAGFDPSRHA